MFTFIIFIIVLGVIVLFHEFGHFITAKKSGMGVYEFGFGFPPRAIGWYKDPETKKWVSVGRKYEREKAPSMIWSINWLPLGGFVSIKGEEGENKSSDSFVAQKYWKKCMVTVAGVLMNVFLAALLLSIGYMVGLPQMLNGVGDKAIIENQRLEIVQVISGTPAKNVDIKNGDSILKIGDIEKPSVVAMQKYVNSHSTDEITLVLKRNGEVIEKKLTPMIYEDTGKGGIGVGLAELGTVSYPWYLALYYGILATGFYLKAIVVTFGMLIYGLFSGTSGAMTEAVAGPIGIAVMTGEVARLGLSYLLQFTALLSLNLAVLNILPIPALDGGRLVFLTIGKIFGKQRGLKYEQVAHTLGFLLLMGLVILVTLKDVLGLFK